MVRSLRSAANCTKRSGVEVSLSNWLCLMFTSLSRVRNVFRFMAFLHAVPLSSSFTGKETPQAVPRFRPSDWRVPQRVVHAEASTKRVQW